ncbi:MAG: hypothetical protein WEC12_00910 [Balneolaceae bacterium]
MNVPNPQHDRFNILMKQLRHKIDQLQSRNRILTEENRELKDRLEKGSRPEDVFSTLGDSERIALRHQIDGLIAKIDQHLEA